MSVIFVLGGDGYCGWPLSLKLASEGYSVVIIDSLVRRSIDIDLNIKSLTPISNIKERVIAANEHNLDISFKQLNIAIDSQQLRQLLEKYQPHAVINMAHQRSVPYSSIDFDKRKWTLENTLTGQICLLEAIKDCSSKTKVLHLGSLGVFGYRDIGGAIPIGKVKTNIFLGSDNEYEIKNHFPLAPDSIYHLSKSLNVQLNEFYARVYNLDITDIYQATVWGCNVQDFEDKRLVNRFDYDSIFGTVINRFCIQSIKNKNLTVYGSGKQQRGFIHISDSTDYIIGLLSKNNNKVGEVNVVSSVSDIFDIKTLAENISSLSTLSKINYMENDRIEAEENFNLENIETNNFMKINDRVHQQLQDLEKYL